MISMEDLEERLVNVRLVVETQLDLFHVVPGVVKLRLGTSGGLLRWLLGLLLLDLHRHHLWGTRLLKGKVRDQAREVLSGRLGARARLQ